MKLHLVRHGETDWNSEGRIQGWVDVGLNETGRLQARKVADQLPRESRYRIVTSPLRRARETADIIADRLGVREVVERPEFRELDQGYWNGLRGSWLLNENSERYRQWTDSPTSTQPPGGESLREVRERVHRGLNELKASVDSPCLLVAHKVVNSLVVHLVGNGSLESVLGSLAGNAEVQTVRFDGGRSDLGE